MAYLNIPRVPPRNERISEDHDSVLSSLQQLIPTFDEYHIRDCFRLGKFNDVSSRPRPVLVKFNCASDVVNILAKYRSLSSNARRFFIKPDLSPVERSIESLLLKEQRVLIDSGTIGKAIKVRGNCIFVNKLLPFQSFVYSSSLNILAITETWLSDHIFDKEILPTGFAIYRSDRISRGGGVLICSSLSIPTRLLSSHFFRYDFY